MTNDELKQVAKRAKDLFADMLDAEDKKDIMNMPIDEIYADYAVTMNSALDDAIHEFAENNNADEQQVIREFNNSNGMVEFSAMIDKYLDRMQTAIITAADDGKLDVDTIVDEAVEEYSKLHVFDEYKYMDIVYNLLEKTALSVEDIASWVDENYKNILNKGRNQFEMSIAAAVKNARKMRKLSKRDFRHKVRMLQKIQNGRTLVAAYKMSDEEFNGYVEDCKNDIQNDSNLLMKVKQEIHNYLESHGNAEDLMSLSLGLKPSRTLNNAILEHMEKKYEGKSLYYSLYDFSAVSQEVFNAVMQSCIDEVKRMHG